jgi:drug/metabolite transporter (DMT)-like permease
VPAFTYAGLIIFSRYLVSKKLTSLDVGAGPLPWAFLVTAAVFHRYLLPMNIDVLGFCVYLGIFTAFLPYVLYAEGLKYMEAGRAGVLSTLEPTFAVIWGVLLLNQAMTIRELVGSAMIIASAAIAAADQSR